MADVDPDALGYKPNPPIPLQESALLTLRLTRGPAAGTELVVQAPSQILGRTRVPRQLQIKDPNVSERHAQIAWEGDCWTIRDLGSSNGTTLNGRSLDRQGMRGCCVGMKFGEAGMRPLAL